MKFDFTIFNKKFLLITASTLALILILVIAFASIILIIFIGCGEQKSYFDPLALIFQFILIYLPSLGFLIYSLIIYLQVNKNEKIEELKSIQSDEFINNFIKEFVSQCQEYLIINLIIVLWLELAKKPIIKVILII